MATCFSSRVFSFHGQFPFLFGYHIGVMNCPIVSIAREFGFESNSILEGLEDRGISVTIGVVDEHIGLVLGRGGQNIMEISQLTGARIKVSDRGDFMSGTNDRKVTITGSQRAIQSAESMIMQKVAYASERVTE